MHGKVCDTLGVKGLRLLLTRDAYRDALLEGSGAARWESHVSLTMSGPISQGDERGGSPWRTQVRVVRAARVDVVGHFEYKYLYRIHAIVSNDHRRLP